MGGLELAKMADFYADLWSSDTFAPACLHGVWWSCTEPRPLMETQPPLAPGSGQVAPPLARQAMAAIS
jgi:hypothetical protein